MTPSARALPLTISAVGGTPLVVDHATELRRRGAAVLAHPLGHRRGGALPDFPPAAEPPVGQVDAAHPGLRGELDELGALQFTFAALTEAELVLGQHGDGAALWGVVGQAG